MRIIQRYPGPSLPGVSKQTILGIDRRQDQEDRSLWSGSSFNASSGSRAFVPGSRLNADATGDPGNNGSRRDHGDLRNHVGSGNTGDPENTVDPWHRHDSAKHIDPYGQTCAEKTARSAGTDLPRIIDLHSRASIVLANNENHAPAASSLDHSILSGRKQDNPVEGKTIEDQSGASRNRFHVPSYQVIMKVTAQVQKN